MKIVIPVSLSDVDKLEAWSEDVLHFGGLHSHSIAFLPTYQVIGSAQTAAEKFIAVGIQAEVLKMELDPTGGWPFAPNIHFFEAARLMLGQNQPWLWMELDARPRCHGWADALAGAYTSCGARFMGSVSPAPWRDTTPFLLNQNGDPTDRPNPNFGKIVRSLDGESDTIMSGVAIYPANMASLDGMSGLMRDFVKGESGSTDKSFDLHLRYVIAAHRRANSDLFADHWNTVNYRVEDGAIVCDPKTDHVGIPQGWEPRTKGGKINPSAVIIHGCKDESLHRLIQSGALDSSLSAARPATVAAAPQSTEANNKIAALEAQIASLTALMLGKTGEVKPAAVTEQLPANDGPSAPAAEAQDMITMAPIIPVKKEAAKRGRPPKKTPSKWATLA